MKRKSTVLISLVILSAIVWTNSVYGAGGDLLWKNTFTVPSPYNVITCDITLSSTLCIVYGQYINYGTTTPIGYIKVYDISTGNLKWERTQDQIVPWSFYKLLLDGNILYISSYRNYSGLWGKTYGAYNANNGDMLWDKPNVIYGTADDNMITKNISAPQSDNKLFEKYIDQAANPPTVNIKAYQA
jgi:hypothetical protein